MNGKQFLSTLKNIGYPGADELDGTSLDWIFDKEELLPFLQWFCDEVQGANVLTPSELSEYETLEASADGVLEGQQLEKALQNLALFESDVLAVPDERLKEEVAFLRDELSCMRQQKCILTQQLNKLMIESTAKMDRLSKLKAVEEAKELEYRKCLEQIHLANLEMNTALDSLVPAVGCLASIYRAPTAGTDAQRSELSPVFISHLDLEPYHKAEECYTQALVAFTKKQFFEGIADMAGQNEGSLYEFLEISNPDLNLIKGESEEVNFDDCKELARIQAFYPLNESKRINALIEDQSLVSGCEFHEQMLLRLKDQPYPNDIAQLGSRLKNVQAQLSVVNKEITRLADQQIPGLIKESASLQAAKILCGDYDLKIARQDYFTSNQLEMIRHLLTQRARSEFISMALEVESKGHRQTQKLLLAIGMTLEQMFSSLEDRMKMMSEIEESCNLLQRTTIDSRDRFLNCLYHALTQETCETEEKPKKLFITYNDLQQSADKLVHKLDRAKASLLSVTHQENQGMMQLEQELAKCEHLLYQQTPSANGLPMLSPPALLESMSRLDGLLNRLEEAVMDIMKDVNNKKKSLQNDPLLSTERELFVYFYNDTNRLRRVFEQLNSRLQLARKT